MGWKRKLQYWRKLRRHYCEFGLKLLSSFSITDFKENLHCAYDCYASYCLFWLFSDWNMKLVWFRSSIPCFWNAKLFLNQNKNLLEPWQNHLWGTVQHTCKKREIPEIYLRKFFLVLSQTVVQTNEVAFILILNDFSYVKVAVNLKHLCFFSVKINISTTGGFRVGFFQPDTNHP